MKLSFFPLDINEGRWNETPTVQLWGVDDNAERIVVISNRVLPYFYLLFDEGEDLPALGRRILAAKEVFPKIIGVEESNRKLLGHPHRVLKVTCQDSEAMVRYSKELPKFLGRGRPYEHDLRLPTRYLIDLMLEPCSWHECEVEEVKLGFDRIDRAYLAETRLVKISEEKTPELRILSFQILAAAPKGSPKPEKDPVLALIVSTNTSTTRTFLCDGDGDAGLLEEFKSHVLEFDPDFIIGFESNRILWPYLSTRSKIGKVRLDIGRDGGEPHTSLFGHTSIAGRVNLDLMDIAAGIPELKVKNIESFARYLKVPTSKKLRSVDESEHYRLWSDGEGRRGFVRELECEAQALTEIAQASSIYTMQLSALTGLPPDEVMTAAVGFRVESHLMRYAHLAGELIPPRGEKLYIPYRGAIVLEPKTGLHDNVLVLDFASMYPTLMEHYNLSPDTLVKPGKQVGLGEVFVIPEVGHRFRKRPDGFYRAALSFLLQDRAHVQERLKSLRQGSMVYGVLKERERAIKLLTNACYGYAGWAGARWYVREVAESASALGRDAIMKTLQKAESLGLKVIYGDTDSLFVGNDQAKVEKLLSWAHSELKLEIKPQHEYVRILFTEAMKRYAGLLPDGSLDIVGLEVVRGDWADVARKLQEKILAILLKDGDVGKAVEETRASIEKLRKRQVAVKDLAIWKTLTKPMEEYTVRTPHVEAAKKMMKAGWHLSVGDKVGYVVVEGRGPVFQRVQPYMNVDLNDVDVEYYFENQIRPAAMRILERFGVKEEELTD